MSSTAIKAAAMVLAIPFLLLLTASAIRVQLRGEWVTWQPPVLEPWLENAQAPPPVLVGRALFGERLYEPAAVLARAYFWGTVGAATLVLCGLLLFAAWRFRTLPMRAPSAAGVMICACARWLPWIALVLYPAFLAEFLAAIYLAEVLCNGAVMYVTPAIALVLAGGAAFFALGFPGSGGAELPPTRLNAILLRREEQPDLYSLPGAEDIHVAASLEPIIVLVHGRTQCHDDLVDGHLLLVPVPLCGMLTEAEFLCLVEQACLPLRWHQLAWRVESIADSVQQLLRRIRETMLDAALTRTVPAALPAMGLCLILSEGRPDASARVMDASFESDRLTAAKLGSRDWARAMLKSYVAMSLWSRFVRQMSHDLKEPAGQGPSYDLAAREFQGYITEARISEALSQLAENSDPGGLPMRLALLGYSGPEAWPELDFHPVEAAIGRLRDSGALERRLSAGERARFLLSPDLTTNRPTP